MPLDTDRPARIAEHTRKTKETDIHVRMNLDGTGASNVDTGIGFLDHMLEGFAKHALIDLDVKASGDLHIDMHHTTEDVGIVMGLCAAKALGDLGGIHRFGHAYVPMDETLTRASLDISKRPYLVWKVAFTRDKLGDFDTELFKEWFAAFGGNAGLCLHVENLYGENNHHIAESCFKALAKAFDMATQIDPRRAGATPSTKGSLGS